MKLRRNTSTVKDPLAGSQNAYWDDEDLLRRLGLKTKGYQWDWTPIGTVRSTLNRVDVAVCAMPAQFWRFTVHLYNQAGPLVIVTGSGTFTDYWPFAEMLLNDVPFETVRQAAGLVIRDDVFVLVGEAEA